ncbi:conjugal transfer protein TraD [Ralstonia nicotianae]|uniref:conjugal transfer protein TraD n=1 Tax=Ralstonia pseudosolanacearum TaxID=1310165 RepID=UPI001402BFD2|nr:conjugal transfer protein TraD [Ralstonia pseudosolanacearum]KAF3458046.1 conjugal transfer protein TraD [Ralstonia solanacearum]NKG02250.1 conjugal transfer protein TraD [Ralstonia solanacearum]UNJ33188.1 conjugal transfer protein TraD [Ralstonia pseudosolanacearum]
MSEPDLKAQIEAIKLTTKAAKLRKLMPSIEAKLAEGVRAAEIVETLRKGGLDLTMGTFRNYLHQYRVKQHGKAVERQATPVGSRPPESAESVSYETDSAATNESGGPVSMQELDRLMKPDPAKQAEDLAHYERLAKQQRRSRDK